MYFVFIKNKFPENGQESWGCKLETKLKMVVNIKIYSNCNLANAYEIRGEKC